MSFQSLHLHADLLRGIAELGYTDPTPIQSAAIPPALEGRDVLACAMTGSGKTAAFLLPILHRLLEKPRGKTRALVVAPTRELAAQILEDLRSLGKRTRITGATIYGGVAMGPQEQAFRRGADVLITTPGRLLDHLRFPYARLDSIEYLVLDEADRMLDMGFLPDVRRILSHLPQQRQTLFFSATMPAPIVALTREMLRSPASVNLQPKAAPASGVTLTAYPVPQKLKSDLMLALLRGGQVAEALVFTRTKHRADRLCRQLVTHGIRAERIHGNRSQAQRTKALAGFKNGTFRVLVATDIAARGIDVEALGHVVNFDVPGMSDDYIHRVGRTARAERTGDAITLVSPEEESDFRAIERAVGRRIERLKLEGFDYEAKSGGDLEIPLAQRIAAIRAKKAEDRARAAAKADRLAGRAPARPAPAASANGTATVKAPAKRTVARAPEGRQQPHSQPSGPQGRATHHGPAASRAQGKRRRG